MQEGQPIAFMSQALKGKALSFLHMRKSYYPSFSSAEVETISPRLVFYY
jgi:hypothetical protein